MAYNLASALFEMAVSHPDTLAIALPAEPGKPLPKSGPIPYNEISFKELAEETNSISRGLLAWGFEAGDRVVLMVPPGFEFITISFAFLQAGIIPVLIDPGIGIKNLKKCIDEAKPIGFVGITKAHIARLVLGWGRATIKKKITLGPRLFWGGGLLKKIREAGHSEAAPICFDAHANDLAGIFFTSGSTGVPKGVMSTHGNMQAQVEMIRNTYDIKPGEIDLPTFPPFALFNPTVGMSTVIPDMNPTKPAQVDPERIIRALQQFKVTNMFGSPALLDRVGRYVEANNIKIPTLNRVLSAGAPVPAKTLRRFSRMLNPTCQIFTPYGATESMPVASIGSHQILKEEIQKHTETGGGICIGKPVDNLEARVIRITDEPIECWSEELEVRQGQIGEIVVKGKNVTQAYFNRDAATKLAKIKDGESFRHRMGDLGYLDAEGNLWFCGRKAHRVKLAGKELYSVQCESILNKHSKVHRTALVGVRGKAVLCVEIDKDVVSPNRERLKKELLELAAENELTQDIQTIFFHPSFPVDIRHNAKIFREKLAVWAGTQ
ncbi:MAG: fatty acid CoA ligase family protein [Bacteroidia bacterium]